MWQPKYSFWDPASRRSNHQENTPDGIQISKISVDRCRGYHHTISSYSETIYTGSTTHSYTKDSTGIETGMVHVTLQFDNVTATPNVIRVKYPDRNISQATHSAISKLQFLTVKARRVHMFDTLA